MYSTFAKYITKYHDKYPFLAPSVSFFQVKNSFRLYPHDLKKGKREREKMAKNRTHEEVTESDSSSEFHGTCVKFRFYEDGGAGRERRWREVEEERGRTVIPRSKRLLTCLRSSTTMSPCEKLWQEQGRGQCYTVRQLVAITSSREICNYSLREKMILSSIQN